MTLTTNDCQICSPNIYDMTWYIVYDINVFNKSCCSEPAVSSQGNEGICHRQIFILVTLLMCVIELSLGAYDFKCNII